MARTSPSSTAGRTATSIDSPLLRRIWSGFRLMSSTWLAGGPQSGRRDRQPALSRLSWQSSSDPVKSGFVTSYARPGGSITGLAVQFEDLASKQMQLVKETLPNAARVAILDHHGVANPDAQKAAETAARALGLTVRVIGVRDEPDLPAMFRAAKAEKVDAMYVLPSPMFNRHRARLAELALKHRLPGIYEAKEYVVAGGLMSYGPSFPELFRRSASYVDRILKGAKAGDLPIERPTKFEMVINLKTAKALDLTIPPSLLLRADQVIE